TARPGSCSTRQGPRRSPAASSACSRIARSPGSSAAARTRWPRASTISRASWRRRSRSSSGSRARARLDDLRGGRRVARGSVPILMPLAYYSRSASQEFWSEHWAGEDLQVLVDIARASPLTRFIERALPPAGCILEAGCGLGQYVVLLRERGH